MPMIKTSTKNELVKFLYGESSKKEEQEILQSISEDEDLKEELVDFGYLRDQISKITLKAPNRAVNKILSFANQSDLESA